VAEKVAVEQFLIRTLRLHLSVILPQFSTLIFNDMLFVPGGRTGEAWDPPSQSSGLSDIGDRLNRKELLDFFDLEGLKALHDTL
jgi:hypothetical protein